VDGDRYGRVDFQARKWRACGNMAGWAGATAHRTARARGQGCRRCPLSHRIAFVLARDRWAGDNRINRTKRSLREGGRCVGVPLMSVPSLSSLLDTSTPRWVPAAGFGARSVAAGSISVYYVWRWGLRLPPTCNSADTLPRIPEQKRIKFNVPCDVGHLFALTM